MSGKLINVEDTKTYLGYIVDFELSVYTQQSLIAKLKGLYNSLGRKYVIDRPVLSERTYAWDGFETWGMIGCFGGGIIGAISGYIQGSSEKFFGFIAGLFEGAIMAVIYGLICGAVLGILGAFFTHIKNKSHNQEVYARELAEYNLEVKMQEERIKKENLQKKVLAVELEEMQRKLDSTLERLNEIYDYDIIDEDYRDIYATSAFLSYFRKKRTYSLGFDPKNGDRGAYNIYEEELRQNLIITNLYEIIERLDEIVETQKEIARGITKANYAIEDMHKDVKRHLGNISDSIENIERCESIQAYNSERMKNELQMMNWMNITFG